MILGVEKYNKMFWDSFFHFSLGLNSLLGSCVHNASMNVQKHERKKERTFLLLFQQSEQRQCKLSLSGQ